MCVCACVCVCVFVCVCAVRVRVCVYVLHQGSVAFCCLAFWRGGKHCINVDLHERCVRYAASYLRVGIRGLNCTHRKPSRFA